MGQFSEMLARRAQQTLANECVNAFIALPHEERQQVAERINEHFRLLAKGPRWSLVCDEPQKPDIEASAEELAKALGWMYLDVELLIGPAQIRPEKRMAIISRMDHASAALAAYRATTKGGEA